MWLAGSAAVTVSAYVLLLGWNATMSLVPEEPGSIGTRCVGPHEPWQVIALGVVLSALVVAGTWFGHQALVSAVTVVTLTTLFTIDAVTVDDPCSDTSLLPVGVVLLFAGSAMAAVLVVAVTSSIRNRGSSGDRRS